MTLKIYTHPSGLRHDTGPNHPESIERLRVLHGLFDEMGLKTVPAMEAELEWIARAHPQSHIDRIMDALPDRGLIYLDSDTVLSPGSWNAALHAAGAVCQAVQDIRNDLITRAFCASRPPGHHAEPEKPMGFCLFNSVFVGALHARSLGFKRVAIVDFDVHHGNGTDAMARLHDGVFFVSTHQWPLFPNTGGPEDQVPGRVLNIPLPSGTGSSEFRKVYSEQVLPALREYAPDLLMISAGFDAHRDDPLAQMNLDDDDFYWVTAELRKIAEESAGGRIVSVLEGGYNLPALKTATRAHLNALSD